MKKTLLTALVLCALFGYTKVADHQNTTTNLTKKIDELQTYIDSKESLNTKISEVPVAWHIDHSLKAILNIYDTLAQSDPESYKRQFNMTRMLVFMTNRIPRGRAKAPKSTLPPDVILEKDILEQIVLVRERIQIIDKLPKNAYFEHPVFGNLNRKKTIQFLEIHTEHHLKIIRDILDL